MGLIFEMIVKFCKHCNKEVDVADSSHWTIRKENGRLRCLVQMRHQKKQHREENLESVRKKDRDRYHKNRTRISEKRKDRYRENITEERKKAKRYLDKNRDKVNKTRKLYYKKNKEKLVKYVTDYKNTHFNYKIASNLRTRLWQAIKGNWKSGSAVKDLGCTIPELKQYLESKFQPGMAWENHGKWHIDHIIPLSKFDLTNKEQLKKACNYTNLQPLWAKENLKKNNK